MKKMIYISFSLFILASLGFFLRKIKLDFIPKAHSQIGSPRKSIKLAQNPPPPSNLDPTQDLPPIPPATTVTPPTSAAPTANGKKSGKEDELPQPLPTPQELDPTLKFVDSGGFIYDPIGRRDPFKPFIESKDLTKPAPQRPTLSGPGTTQPEGIKVESLESEDLAKYRLVGILWEVHDPKAMVLGPNGKVYMLHKQTRIGNNNGYVAAIREGEVVVVEVSADTKVPSTRIMTLQK